MISYSELLLIIIQGLWIVLFAPLLSGLIQKSKALLQGRVGPRVFQPYYDLLKYFHKEAVFSIYHTWLTRFTPYIVFTTTLVTSFLLPIISNGFGSFSDVLLFIYIFAIARIFTALAALDTASSFGGMGASRELALNTVIEPAFILAIIAVVIQGKTTNFPLLLETLHESPFYVSLPYLLTFLAMIFVILGETGRLPIDNLDTHLELTMIHEGMVLEYSGRYLSLMKLSSMLKQFILITLFVLLFLPFGQPIGDGMMAAIGSLLLITGKVFFVGIVIAIIETTYAKVRLYQVPKLFITSMTLSFLAIIVHLLF